MALTAKQEAFCQAIADGKNQSEAYRLAGYSVEKMDNEAVNVAASKLAKNTKVYPRVQELRGKLENKQLWTREQSVTTIIRGLESAEKNDKPMEMFKGVELLNKMFGYDAPQKLELTHKKNIADMTDEELLAYHKLLETKDNE